MMEIVRHLLIALLVLLLAVAAVSDLRARIIANRLNLLIALVAPVWWWATRLDATGIAWQLGAAIAALLLFGALFAAGMMGGGDVKLIAALALWLPLGALARMLVIMSLAGGAVTLLTLGWHRWRRASGQAEVPYGVAIVAAALLTVANDILTTPVA